MSRVREWGLVPIERCNEEKARKERSVLLALGSGLREQRVSHRLNKGRHWLDSGRHELGWARHRLH